LAQWLVVTLAMGNGSAGSAKLGSSEEHKNLMSTYGPGSGSFDVSMQMQGLSSVVTPTIKDRWVLGAQNLVFTQDLIIMQGPSAFVHRCLDSNMPVTSKEVVRKGTKYALSFIFLLAVPLFAPAAYANFIMQYSWDATKVGDRQIKWSTEHAGIPGLKMYKDNDDFIPKNAKIDLVRLRHELANATEYQKASDVLYLDNQSFQSQLEYCVVQILIGSLSVIICGFTYAIRVGLEHRKFTSKLTFLVLHFQWFSDNYPKLKYTSGKIFNDKVHLFKLVPCVWFSMMVSFLVIVPMCIFGLDRHSWELQASSKTWIMVLRVMPSCTVAAYAIGNLYLQACNSTFSHWLSSPIEYAITERQFEVEMEGLYAKLTKHADYFVVTIQEIEALAAMRSVEMWLRWNTLKHFCSASDQKELYEAEAEMNEGRWPRANKILGVLLDRNKESNKEQKGQFRQAREAVLQHCLIHHVYVVDTKADISFWVDVRKGTCKNTRDREDGEGELGEAGV
jgi:hypothetical protein